MRLGDEAGEIGWDLFRQAVERSFLHPKSNNGMYASTSILIIFPLKVVLLDGACSLKSWSFSSFSWVFGPCNTLLGM